MKSLFLFTAFILLVLLSAGQTEKGTWLLGGSFDFSSSKQKIWGNETTTTQVEFSPTIGYFIVPNLAVGINAGIQTTKDKYPGSTSDDKTTLSAVGPFARYYLGAGSKAKFLAGAAMLFGSTKGILDYSKHTITAYQFEAGPAIFLTESVAVEFLLNYVNQHFKGQESFYDADASQFGFSLGFQFYLKKKSHS